MMSDSGFPKNYLDLLTLQIWQILLKAASEKKRFQIFIHEKFILSL